MGQQAQQHHSQIDAHLGSSPLSCGVGGMFLPFLDKGNGVSRDSEIRPKSQS